MLPHTGAIATMVTFAWRDPLRRPPLQSKKVMSAHQAIIAQLEPSSRSLAHQAIDSLTLDSPHVSDVLQEHTVVHSACWLALIAMREVSVQERTMSIQDRQHLSRFAQLLAL